MFDFLDVERLSKMPCHHEPLPNAREIIQDQADTSDQPHESLWRFGKAEKTNQKQNMENASFFSRNILALDVSNDKVISKRSFK